MNFLQFLTFWLMFGAMLKTFYDMESARGQVLPKGHLIDFSKQTQD